MNPGPWVSPRSVQGKSAVVAAVLNFFFGLGYVYLNYRKVLGVPTIGFVVIAIILYFVLGFFTFGIITFILGVLLAIDGWQKGEGQRGFISAE
jgi:hypothetical protein